MEPPRLQQQARFVDRRSGFSLRRPPRASYACGALNPIYRCGYGAVNRSDRCGHSVVAPLIRKEVQARARAVCFAGDVEPASDYRTPYVGLFAQRFGDRPIGWACAQRESSASKSSFERNLFNM